MTEEELQKLKANLPDWEELVNKLSGYMASTGKTYANHFATLKRWAEKDREEYLKKHPECDYGEPEDFYKDNTDNITGKIGIWL